MYVGLYGTGHVKLSHSRKKQTKLFKLTWISSSYSWFYVQYQLVDWNIYYHLIPDYWNLKNSSCTIYCILYTVPHPSSVYVVIHKLYSHFPSSQCRCTGTGTGMREDSGVRRSQSETSGFASAPFRRWRVLQAMITSDLRNLTSPSWPDKLLLLCSGNL